jgi:two-component system capsular synthesis sensor histidine kinase RcsC
MAIHPIIFVDDNVQYLELVESIIKKTGIYAHYATSGEEALGILKGHPCEIMFTDLHMPGMDGFLLSKSVREILPEIRIIMVTSAASAYLSRLAATVGISKVIAKPHDIAGFQEIVACASPTA